MNEIHRIEDGTRFSGQEVRFDLHASDLPQTSELDQVWLNAARDAMRAASRGEKKRELTPDEEKAHQIAKFSVGTTGMRHDFLAEMDLPPAA